MNKTPYSNNTEPKVGDVVCFASDDDGKKYVVQSVGGGRLGNKVSVVPQNEPNTFAREYYFNCFCPQEKVN